MRSFLGLLIRFRDDERGIFAVIFGVMAIVLVAMAGAAVDYTAVETAKTRAQVALDSAALGLQPTIYDTPAPTVDSLKTKGTALLTQRINDGLITAVVDGATVTTGDGTLRLTASITVPTYFVSLLGIKTLTAKLVSEATRKRLNLEVAMVLDNSGSMDKQSRMTNLKKAALCAMNVLYNSLDECTDAKVTAMNDVAPTEKNIWIGIVPFTGFVNVGKGYKTADWMDTTGLSSISNDNFDDDDNEATPYTGTVNRFTLYTNIGVTWRGCVEARPYPYDTNDAEPTAATPDTLFVPEFAPDNPSGYDNSYLNDRPSACTNKDGGTWSEKNAKTGCTSTWNNNASDTTKLTTYNNCSSTATVTRTQTNWDGSNASPVAATAPATMPDKNGIAIPADCSTSYTSKKSGSGSSTRYALTWTKTCAYQFSDRVLQERLCKYVSAAVTSTSSSPNDDCPTNALTPLTATKATIKTAINDMSPQGYTNIHQGTIWGYHMLSPGKPLTEGKAFEASTSKVMIVMTDGENTVDNYGSTAINLADTMQAYGYPGVRSTTGGQSYNGRIYSSANPYPDSDEAVTEAMDARTLEACTNAKAAGITIYTIGLNAPNQKTIDLLTDCASGDDLAYFPTASSELTDVFEEIANQLANLRLSQ